MHVVLLLKMTSRQQSRSDRSVAITWTNVQSTQQGFPHSPRGNYNGKPAWSFFFRSREIKDRICVQTLSSLDTKKHRTHVYWKNQIYGQNSTIFLKHLDTVAAKFILKNFYSQLLCTKTTIPTYIEECHAKVSPQKCTSFAMAIVHFPRNVVEMKTILHRVSFLIN